MIHNWSDRYQAGDDSTMYRKRSYLYVTDDTLEPILSHAQPPQTNITELIIIAPRYTCRDVSRVLELFPSVTHVRIHDITWSYELIIPSHVQSIDLYRCPAAYIASCKNAPSIHLTNIVLDTSALHHLTQQQHTSIGLRNVSIDTQTQQPHAWNDTLASLTLVHSPNMHAATLPTTLQSLAIIQHHNEPLIMPAHTSLPNLIRCSLWGKHISPSKLPLLPSLRELSIKQADTSLSLFERYATQLTHLRYHPHQPNIAALQNILTRSAQLTHLDVSSVDASTGILDAIPNDTLQRLSLIDSKIGTTLAQKEWSALHTLSLESSIDASFKHAVFPSLRSLDLSWTRLTAQQLLEYAEANHMIKSVQELSLDHTSIEDQDERFLQWVNTQPLIHLSMQHLLGVSADAFRRFMHALPPTLRSLVAGENGSPDPIVPHITDTHALHLEYLQIGSSDVDEHTFSPPQPSSSTPSAWPHLTYASLPVSSHAACAKWLEWIAQGHMPNAHEISLEYSDAYLAETIDHTLTSILKTTQSKRPHTLIELR